MTELRPQTNGVDEHDKRRPSGTWGAPAQAPYPLAGRLGWPEPGNGARATARRRTPLAAATALVPAAERGRAACVAQSGTYSLSDRSYVAVVSTPIFTSVGGRPKTSGWTVLWAVESYASTSSYPCRCVDRTPNTAFAFGVGRTGCRKRPISLDGFLKGNPPSLRAAPPTESLGSFETCLASDSRCWTPAHHQGLDPIARSARGQSADDERALRSQPCAGVWLPGPICVGTIG